MTGVEYRNGRGEETFSSSAGIIKRHDILFNIIPSKKMYGQTIGLGGNIVHGTIGKMICCNNGLGILGVNIFV